MPKKTHSNSSKTHENRRAFRTNRKKLKMRKTIEIQNLKCGGCANTVITKLYTLEAISNVEVEVGTSKVSFDYTSSNNLKRVEKKLIQLGYPPVGLDNTIASKAKSFVSCAVGKMS